MWKKTNSRHVPIPGRALNTAFPQLHQSTERMTFHSILFDDPEDQIKAQSVVAPSFFVDLNLNQIVDAVTATKFEYNLKPFFYVPITDLDTIEYRHEIMRDLDTSLLLSAIKDFAQGLRIVRQHLGQAEKLHHQHQKESWLLDAAEIYCDQVERLLRGLAGSRLRSRGFLGFREYLETYVSSERFTAILAETGKLKKNLASIEYAIEIRDSSFTVSKYESEPNYSTDVERTFQKFKQGAVKDYAVNFPDRPDMNHIEEAILDFLSGLYPEIFQELDEYCVRNSGFLDGAIAVFDREVQFYVGYLDYIALLQQAGLNFCYPVISNIEKNVRGEDGFDLALAHKLVSENQLVVCNDFYLKDSERILVVSGPNQGGKTTFARMFGQMHFLGSLGCPVPGKNARLFLFDALFTHFEREEDIRNLRGKLEDDLVRIHEILERATSRSVIVINEIFTSTTLRDAIALGKKVIGKIAEMDSLCVCVTFIDELASLSQKTVSMVSTVLPESPATRTFKVVRRFADGLSYAISIAEKYRLTYQAITERLKS